MPTRTVSFLACCVLESTGSSWWSSRGLVSGFCMIWEPFFKKSAGCARNGASRSSGTSCQGLVAENESGVVWTRTRIAPVFYSRLSPGETDYAGEFAARAREISAIDGG